MSSLAKLPFPANRNFCNEEWSTKTPKIATKANFEIYPQKDTVFGRFQYQNVWSYPIKTAFSTP